MRSLEHLLRGNRRIPAVLYLAMCLLRLIDEFVCTQPILIAVLEVAAADDDQFGYDVVFI
jgi:hypothetical protein